MASALERRPSGHDCAGLISVKSGHCDGCIGFHAKALARIGVAREQVIEAPAVAVYMGGGPSLMYAADAIHAFDEFQDQAPTRAATSAA